MQNTNLNGRIFGGMTVTYRQSVIKKRSLRQGYFVHLEDMIHTWNVSRKIEAFKEAKSSFGLFYDNKSQQFILG